MKTNPPNAFLLPLLLAAALTLHAEPSATLAIERPAAAAAATVRIIGPDSQVVERRFGAEESVVLQATNRSGAALADGRYTYEVVFAPRLDPAQLVAAEVGRKAGDVALPADWPQAIAPVSGYFSIANGLFFDPTALEAGARSPAAPIDPSNPAVLPSPDDQVIADDLIVQGSTCTGFDCVNNETFGFDTLRLKENNTRIGFSDTSVGTFPSNDWELTANDSASGGANRLSITDVTGSTTPFTVTAGAPTGSVFVDSSGKLGFKTITPVLDLHTSSSNTPGLRLEQTNAGGFTAQTWDVAGNEANFFIRDVTSGSRLPFRIRPGAPTSSIDIAANGNVGLGIAAPAAGVHLRHAAAFSESWLLVDVPDDANAATEDRRLELDNQGNLFVSGTITQLSSRTAKENFQRIAGDQVLSRLSALPIWSWNYLVGTRDDRHIGPVAEDFYQAFGFGRSAHSLAPSDVAGVALAAAQALRQQVAERDRQIDRLEARLAKLEALLAPGANVGYTSAEAQGH